MHLTGIVGRSPIGLTYKLLTRLAALVAAVAIFLGVAAALGTQPATAAQSLHTQKTESLMCPITTSADLYREPYELRGRTRYRAILHTHGVIGFNEYLFVACRINVKVRVKAGGEVINTVTHQAVAGAKWDPWGNKKWYDFYDQLPIEDLDDADALEVVHEQQ